MSARDEDADNPSAPGRRSRATNASSAKRRRATFRKTYETSGPLAGLSVRGANALKNAGWNDRDQVREAILSGRLGTEGRLRGFGPILWQETLAWLGWEQGHITFLRHAPLPPLATRLREFMAPELSLSTELPSAEPAYRPFVQAWNLALLPPGSEREQAVAVACTGLSDELRLSTARRLVKLIQRKRDWFPEDRRVIVACVPIVSSEGIRLQVRWSPPAGTFGPPLDLSGPTVS